MTFFLEFVRGFESFESDRPCVTVFGSACFAAGHPHYELARAVGREFARTGYAVADPEEAVRLVERERRGQAETTRCHP